MINIDEWWPLLSPSFILYICSHRNGMDGNWRKERKKLISQINLCYCHNQQQGNSAYLAHFLFVDCSNQITQQQSLGCEFQTNYSILLSWVNSSIPSHRIFPIPS
jgi:hypothetical protein